MRSILSPSSPLRHLFFCDSNHPIISSSLPLLNQSQEEGRKWSGVCIGVSTRMSALCQSTMPSCPLASSVPSSDGWVSLFFVPPQRFDRIVRPRGMIWMPELLWMPASPDVGKCFCRGGCGLPRTGPLISLTSSCDVECISQQIAPPRSPPDLTEPRGRTESPRMPSCLREWESELETEPRWRCWW